MKVECLTFGRTEHGAPPSGDRCSVTRWEAIDAQVRLQQRSKSVTPPSGCSAGGARRSRADRGAARASRAEDERAVVSDPFSGDSIVAMEATRRGLPVYTQGVRPCPSPAAERAHFVDPENWSAPPRVCRLSGPATHPTVWHGLPAARRRRRGVGLLLGPGHQLPRLRTSRSSLPLPMLSRASRKADKRIAGGAARLADGSPARGTTSPMAMRWVRQELSSSFRSCFLDVRPPVRITTAAISSLPSSVRRRSGSACWFSARAELTGADTCTSTGRPPGKRECGLPIAMR